MRSVGHIAIFLGLLAGNSAFAQDQTNPLIFDAAPGALPTEAPAPTPSIILGRLTPELDGVPSGIEPPLADVQQSEISYEDLEARRALRESDPELFETLVQAGAFDPPEDVLVVALQTELERMGCYTRGVDGRWGPGSAAGAALYLRTLGVEAPPEPAIPLFRQIMREDAVECPAQVAPTPVRTAPPSAARPTRPSGGTTTTRPSRPVVAQPTPPAQAAPAPQPNRRIDPARLRLPGGLGG